MTGKTQSLISAITALMPTDQVGLNLAVIGVDTGMPVTWQSGLSRREALENILKEKGLRAVISGGELLVTNADAPSTEAKKTPAATAPALESYSLLAGQSLEPQLRAWGAKDGWEVIWSLQKDWIVPNGVTFQGSFESAIQQVVESLAANGANIQSDIYQGNKTIVIHEMGDKK